MLPFDDSARNMFNARCRSIDKFFQSKQLSRVHRERLLKHGFIREVIRGWYIPAMPDEKPGDSTSWYTSFWDFCGAYLSQRFDKSWCLSPEQSLSLHIVDRTVPQQLFGQSFSKCAHPNAYCLIGDDRCIRRIVVLLVGNPSVIAGRLVGAFRNIGRELIADNILKGMQAADLKVQEEDPFAEKVQISFGRRDASPYVNRMRLM